MIIFIVIYCLVFSTWIQKITFSRAYHGTSAYTLNISPLFNNLTDSLTPTWIVSQANITSTIRFFDSSPFNSINTHIILTQIPSIYEKNAIVYPFLLPSSIVLVNLITANIEQIGTSHAWSR